MEAILGRKGGARSSKSLVDLFVALAQRLAGTLALPGLMILGENGVVIGWGTTHNLGMSLSLVVRLFWLVLFLAPGVLLGQSFRLESEQITRGPQNHFFGYIGHVQNIPWNGDGRFILAMRTDFQDHLPDVKEPAEVVLIDTQMDYAVEVVDHTRAWNPQQGTMFYWNPEAPETQFFFNDRDPETGKVFVVLFDISRPTGERRVREFRFPATPFGNSGVAQRGGAFLGINYGRLDWLRRVTGYRGAYDWTRDWLHPADDGVFRVDVGTGEARLLVSFATLADRLKAELPHVATTPLFINHTLWNREGDRIFFFVRGHFGNRERRINASFVMDQDGGQLTRMTRHIGGHPEWDYGHRLIGRQEDRQILFDTDIQQVVGQLGTPEVFPDPEGDIALSPDGRWLVNGFKDRSARANYYVVYRRSDGAHQRSSGFPIGQWVSGDLRQDPSPNWNRDGTQILVPGLAADGKSRQLFLLHVRDSKQAQ